MTEEESLCSSPSQGSFSLWELFFLNDIVIVLKAEMATVTTGTVKMDNHLNDEEGSMLHRATNIAGFGLTRVCIFYMFVVSCV